MTSSSFKRTANFLSAQQFGQVHGAIIMIIGVAIAGPSALVHQHGHDRCRAIGAILRPVRAKGYGRCYVMTAWHSFESIALHGLPPCVIQRYTAFVTETLQHGEPFVTSISPRHCCTILALQHFNVANANSRFSPTRLSGRIFDEEIGERLPIFCLKNRLKSLDRPLSNHEHKQRQTPHNCHPIKQGCVCQTLREVANTALHHESPLHFDLPEAMAISSNGARYRPAEYA